MDIPSSSSRSRSIQVAPPFTPHHRGPRRRPRRCRLKTRVGRKEQHDEKDRGIYPTRGIRADQDRVAGARVSLPLDTRGSTLTVNVRPKLKVEVVVEDKDKGLVVETILKHARTGEVGDGKIFVLPVEEAIRIRTGEKGEEVLDPHTETEIPA
jgi:nitrogen regulatory protein P-II